MVRKSKPSPGQSVMFDKHGEILVVPLVRPPAPPSPPSDYRSMKWKFERYHAANPHVYDLIVKICHELIEKGIFKCSTRAIMGRIRWEHIIKTKGEDPFKLNDRYSPYYARMIMEKVPKLKGFFDTRFIDDD